jgi:hypothetical protein
MSAERSLASVIFTRCRQEGECLVWTGARNDAGYGQLQWDGRVQYVHRLVYATQIGPIPEGMYVCHKCDNPPCFAPDHLFLGTNADNQRDASAKGRKPRGSAHLGHRLSDEQVDRIRDSVDNQRDLAAALGVSQSLISRIRAGKRRVAA